ncbi:cupin domain-containing protein [Bifidobacterium tsurumiense]|uniref:Cupin domain protein, PF06172 family n=1 Tax=Bifidobacterium tsurumiense TaxID=356829 RepID=A0A087EC73_9BIFI|nr:cupin domain-containing protein [Bifidobacterium tsurumiense]KFJ05374.1 cupin domain protein, PF06172 family [Bifidobacterium tsurumiense]MSS12301.1 cupin domain-containing protein [Bifidobacterium tsurumiense]
MSVALTDMSAYAQSLVHKLGLEAHPEGGWYVRDWQSPHTDIASERPLASLIYFLLPTGDASAWHKVDADELWLWHGPSRLNLQLGGSGDSPLADAECTTIVLGSGLSTRHEKSTPASNAAVPVGHAIVPAGVWQRTLPATGDVLVSCVVSPGFVFSGFTLDE